MKHLFFCIFFLLALCHTLPAWGQILRVATWNVENLFDTVPQPGKDDHEFLPSAPRAWNSPRYWRKLKGIAQTLAAMQLPQLVGLQEVENDTVLRDLTRRTMLWPAHYKYTVTDSPDRRGVDVALLYQAETFQLLHHRAVRVPSTEQGLPPTRDILVAALQHGGDTLHVCVVHMPSRRAGNAASKENRRLAMQTLCNVLDSLQGRDVIVLGDFNAEPGDRALEVLSPYVHSLLPHDRRTLRRRRGTYYFRGVWGFLDNIFVSPSLRECATGQARECRFPWLVRTAKETPHRTYGGEAYLGGTSDHLPLMVDVVLQ